MPDPAVIGAAWDGQGEPGKRCTVFLSVWRETGIPLQNTLPLAPDLTGPEQCGISASPMRVIAGITTPSLS